MRLIDADELYRIVKTECNKYGKPSICFECGNKVLDFIDNAPTVENIISATDFKKRLNNMEYIYLQACYNDIIDAIECEVTYFKEKGINE